MTIDPTRLRQLAGLTEAPVDDRPEDERQLDQEEAERSAIYRRVREVLSKTQSLNGNPDMLAELDTNTVMVDLDDLTAVLKSDLDLIEAQGFKIKYMTPRSYSLSICLIIPQ